MTLISFFFKKKKETCLLLDPMPHHLLHFEICRILCGLISQHSSFFFTNKISLEVSMGRKREEATVRSDCSCSALAN